MSRVPNKGPGNRIWIFVALVVLAAVAIIIYPRFQNRTIDVTITGIPDLHYRGFSTWPTPRDFDGPGTIFKVEHGQFEYFTMAPVKNQLAGDESLASVERHGKWKGDVLAQFLAVGTPGLSVGSTQDVDVSVGFSGAERWRVDGPVLEQAISNLKLPLNDSDHFYVVREAISVSKMTYKVTIANGDSGSIGLSKNEVIGKGDLTVKEVDKGTYVIDQTFDKPYYIFYLAAEIRPHLGITNTQNVLFINQSSTLKWTSEVRPDTGQS